MSWLLPALKILMINWGKTVQWSGIHRHRNVGGSGLGRKFLNKWMLFTIYCGLSRTVLQNLDVGAHLLWIFLGLLGNCKFELRLQFLVSLKWRHACQISKRKVKPLNQVRGIAYRIAENRRRVRWGANHCIKLPKEQYVGRHLRACRTQSSMQSMTRSKSQTMSFAYIRTHQKSFGRGLWLKHPNSYIMKEIHKQQQKQLALPGTHSHHR